MIKLNQICDEKDCTACQVCKYVCPTQAITIRENEKGFFYPVINQEKCVGCYKCQKKCPAINLHKDFNEPVKVYAGWIRDNESRHYSTSGGVAYALSKKIVTEGGIFCGCRWNVDHAEHAFAESIDELHQFQGSKYAYSDVRNCYVQVKNYLEQGRKVLFVGTGCQVAGLKTYLQRTYNNLILVDLLCHGIPSQKAIRERLQDEEVHNSKNVVNMRFRDKHEDLLHTYCKYTFSDGSFSNYPVFQDAFFRGFVTNHLLRPNCFSCPYARRKRISDITLADFWGYYPIKLSYLKYQDGVSLCLANTHKGNDFLREVQNLKIEERDYETARKGNRNLNGPQIKPSSYDDFWTRYLSGEKLIDLSKEFFPSTPVPPAMKNGAKTYVIAVLGNLIGEKGILSIKRLIKNSLRWLYVPLIKFVSKPQKDKEDKDKYLLFEKLQPGGRRVFYFGVTAHRNLGDLAQRYCITKWIEEYYPSYEIVMVESDVIVNRKISNRFFEHLKLIYGKDDIIVFQSGYCTQDLGGNHPLMHRLVCSNMPEAKILMMPQTIYFRHEKNRKKCAENHNNARRMLFLARDKVSYEQAQKMFPDIHVEAYPDIVTTLIGAINFNNPRNGVCLCTRNDGEKYYSDIEIDYLEDKLITDGIRVARKDTQSFQSVNEIINNLHFFIREEIESYSHYEVTITDRYHGTIFSLCAGTPVIIIKTNDHKVVTGADWFKGVYDDYVYVAEDLDDAYNLCKKVRATKLNHTLPPYFKQTYYDKLKEYFESL